MAASALASFTIPASAPFLPTLIKALLEGRLVRAFRPGADPLALATATLYLPTRRACRLARDVFLDVLGSEAAILPRIVAIGDIDEDEIVFAEARRGRSRRAGAGRCRRRSAASSASSLLAALIHDLGAAAIAPAKAERRWSPTIPAAALALADELARLHGRHDHAAGAVRTGSTRSCRTSMDEYWQITLRFPEDRPQAWPAILAERGEIEPAARRDRLIEAEAERLKRAAAAR